MFGSTGRSATVASSPAPSTQRRLASARCYGAAREGARKGYTRGMSPPGWSGRGTRGASGQGGRVYANRVARFIRAFRRGQDTEEPAPLPIARLEGGQGEIPAHADHELARGGVVGLAGIADVEVFPEADQAAFLLVDATRGALGVVDGHAGVEIDDGLIHAQAVVGVPALDRDGLQVRGSHA